MQLHEERVSLHGVDEAVEGVELSPVDGGRPARKGGVGVATPGESQSQADLNAPRNLNSEPKSKARPSSRSRHERGGVSLSGSGCPRHGELKSRETARMF